MKIENIEDIKEEIRLLKERKELILQQKLYKNNLFELCNLAGFKDLTKCHQDLCDAEAKSRDKTRRLFMHPRSTFKTVILTITNTVREILLNPNIRVLLVSSTETNAKKSLGLIKDVFWINEDFRKIFPEFCPPLDAKEWGTQLAFTSPKRTATNLKEETVEAVGVGQRVTGRHFDKIIFNDIVTPETVTTPNQIQNTKDYVAYCISVLDQPKINRMDMEGTRYDFDDVYGVWEENTEKKKKNYFSYKRSAIVQDKEGKDVPLFPERLDIETLKQIREDQGSYIYSCQYLLDPIDSATATFKRNQIQYIPRKQLPRPAHDKAFQKFTCIDVAISESTTADYSVINTSMFDSEGIEYVIDIKYGRWNTNILLENIINVNKFYHPVIVGIEVVAFQKVIANILYDYNLKSEDIIPVQELPRDTNISKNMRIKSLQWRFQNHKIFFCDDLDKEFIENQILRFNPDRKHNKDDLLDTIADMEQIKIIPDKIMENEYIKNPLKRYVEWLLEPGEDIDEDFEDLDSEGVFMEVENEHNAINY